MGVHMACITSGGRLSNLSMVRSRCWAYVGRKVLALELASKSSRGQDARTFIGMSFVFQRKSRIREITSLAAKGVGEGGPVEQWCGMLASVDTDIQGSPEMYVEKDDKKCASAGMACVDIPHSEQWGSAQERWNETRAAFNVHSPEIYSPRDRGAGVEPDIDAYGERAADTIHAQRARQVSGLVSSMSKNK
jgi:hypothetical protein